MSTRATLAYIEVKIPAQAAYQGRWHLYQDANDEHGEYVYLESPAEEALMIPTPVWNELRQAKGETW